MIIFHGLGDIINSTIITKAIKTTPCNLTIYTASCYQSAFYINQYVDEIRILEADHKTAVKLDYQINDKILRSGQWDKIIRPAPYDNYGIDGQSLIDIYKIQAKTLGYNGIIRPILNITQQEVEDAVNWLILRKLDNFILLETQFGSSQSFWDKTYTEAAISLIGSLRKDLQIVLTHRTDPNLEQYNKIIRTTTLDVDFRYIVPIYNKCKAFIGVSSAASCIVHSNQCSDIIPHLEFCNGRWWSTADYEFKKNKEISYDPTWESISKKIIKVITNI